MREAEGRRGGSGGRRGMRGEGEGGMRGEGGVVKYEGKGI